MKRIAATFALATVCACADGPAPEEAAAPTLAAEAPKPEAVAPPPKPTIDPLAPPKLVPLWTVETGLDAPEGAAVAPDGSYFISNVVGGALDADGNGYISHIAADGSMLAARWAEGLDSPKGMVVRDGILHVADLTQVRMYDVETGTPLPPVIVPETVMLNDMTLWRDEVFVSDSRTGKVHMLTPDGSTVFLEGDLLEGVNGILGDGRRLLLVTMASGSLYEVDMTGELIEIANGMPSADGIGLVPGGGFLVSSWPGEVYFVSDTGVVTSLVNTRDEGINHNDLSVFGDIVISPNWRPAMVTAWRIER